MNAWIYIGSVAVLASGPIVGVVLGSRAFDAPRPDDTPEPVTCSDDTMEIPRITASVDPHMY